MKILLENIIGKVGELIISYDKITKEKELLVKEKESYLEKINSLKSEINNLNIYIKELKVSKSLSNNEHDNSLAKKKINMFLREIDKCIALLNN